MAEQNHNIIIHNVNDDGMAEENHNIIINNNNDEDNEDTSNRPACAACKHQRKRCKKDCPLAMHFPASMNDEFSAIHKVFGISNISKMIKGLDAQQQDEAVKSFRWEAKGWKDDPVHGPYGNYRQLEEENKQLKEQLRIQHQVLQSQIVRDSFQGQQNGYDERELPPVENIWNYSCHSSENLSLNSPFHSYTSLLDTGGPHRRQWIALQAAPAGAAAPVPVPAPKPGPQPMPPQVSLPEHTRENMTRREFPQVPSAFQSSFTVQRQYNERQRGNRRVLHPAAGSNNNVQVQERVDDGNSPAGILPSRAMPGYPVPHLSTGTGGAVGDNNFANNSRVPYGIFQGYSPYPVSQYPLGLQHSTESMF